MKFLIASILALSLVGCTGRTQLGECIGINDHENPKLEYNYSAWNIALGALFSETIVVPLVVVFADLKCPVATR
jgi:hypothetical protein